MIRHIVFFSARDAGDVERIRRGLSILTAIPHADRLEIAVNSRADSLSGDVDLVVYGEFADAAALEAYKAHPLYQRSIDRVRPLREMRIAADFDAADAATVPLEPTE
ncbi:Dabb family protein [Methylobrevis pamukkalensis]|uniref:Stress responsive A/B Barrel Domain protein n=1 Tax=Methylobrevis pamukkalensis TaxID=1439726 RepID=A0A1E3H384_9HYPH|nr:Dabb family protein [Methylobrevis pamukkalensis]ODN70788.1 Stress responsive A/B Barrel Domain protein [Methylobrevis pamukkalensis]